MSTPQQGAPKRVWTPEQDELVRQIFSTTNMKARRDVMARLLPELAPIGHYAAYKRAVDLGCLYPLKTKGPVWSEAELAILESSAHCPVATIRARLARRGYRRSMAAIVHQRLETCGTRVDCQQSAGMYSATQAAALIGSYPFLVGTYIRRGWLRASRTESSSDKYAYRIKAADLRQFVIQHTAYVNLERVDKYAFIDLLCPQHGAKGSADKAAGPKPAPDCTVAA